MENLSQIIEAILFAVGRSISTKELSETLDLEILEINKAIIELEKKYDNEDLAIVLVKVNNEHQLVSNKKYFKQVSAFLENSKKDTLSTTCLEVLSIIAYNSNITKSEIENIRGVNSDSQVSRLLEYGLIEETARLKLPGRPAIFAVTNEFLKCMGINKLEELPDYDTLKDVRKKVEDVIETEKNIEEEVK